MKKYRITEGAIIDKIICKTRYEQCTREKLLNRLMIGFWETIKINPKKEENYHKITIKNISNNELIKKFKKEEISFLISYKYIEEYENIKKK